MSLEDQLRDIVLRETQIDPALLVPGARLDELGLDSLDVVMIVNAVENELGIGELSPQQLMEIRRIEDVVEVVRERLARKAAS